MIDPRSAYLATASAQYGVIHRRQLLAAGVNKDGIHRLTRSGLLTRQLPSVFAVGGSPGGDLRRLMGVALWVGPGAAISHRSAAALRGWDGFRLAPPDHVLTVRKRRPVADVIVHVTDRLPALELSAVGPIPVTSIPRTLLDLAATSDRRLEAALDEALRKGSSLSAIALFLDRPEMVGRGGTRRLGDLLAVRMPQSAVTHSEMEARFRRIVKKFHLPEPVGQCPIQLWGYRVHADFAYPQAMLAIECDSYAWHSDRQAFDRDRERDAELQMRGWVVLRFTWSMLKWRERWVAEQVRRHLALRMELSLNR